VQISSSKERDQHRNRGDCEEKLVTLLKRAIQRKKTRRPTKPTRGSVERRLKEKKRRSQIKANRRKGEMD
jgi:ribosome-associated protein